MPAQNANQAAFASYISDSRKRNIPDAIIDAARLCLADWMAVAIGAGDEPAGNIVRKTVAEWQSNGRAHVLYGGTAAPAMAALANGTLAHCLDFDDTHIGAICHTSAPVWAATLAVGEHRGSSEHDMLRAFVTGYEVATRAGGGLGQAVTARGWHSTGVWGRVGAAAATAALLGLDQYQAANALGAAATQAGGLTASFGTMAKPFHAGKAAMDGVLAAELAATGFTAATGILDSAGGLDKALIQDGSLQIRAPDFSGWEIVENSFKPYAACHLVHPSADAARALGVKADAIQRIRVQVSPLAMQITGTASGRPETALAAKFDLKYCIAMALHGQMLSAADFLEPWTPNQKVMATAALIEPRADASEGIASARIDAELLDGAVKSSIIVTAKGHPGNPMTWDDMWHKFNGLVSEKLGSETAPLFAAIRNFGSGTSLAEIARICQALRTPAGEMHSVSTAAQAPSA